MKVLITGGVRSGKSSFAEKLATSFGEKVVYVATATAGDEEMRERIAKHQSRRPPNWTTVEEPVNLRDVLLTARGDAVLVDCLTLWVTNLLLKEEDVVGKAYEVVEIFPKITVPLIFVTNEVGSGIVPDNPLARKFRDVAGLVNQVFAKYCDEVYLTVAGIPVKIKGVS
ncbi:bifunctional adenosylcobinamide kinase/adenosylcobinamide-phosphate guanylyltransferase [Carboxydothermus pertinax]|uniref:Adenosylcobinamide kinase n=1 Tax=Carboxydothermus pertinax TaxID=870242 RepID=A0A1L8CSV5_9THEO|nr:bifunctional adenosylcobinamide kinase/adenosylcobinamide-phosphate guanylyltransferase [Carboxydothermus pertinax]GAV22010.1 adenosylcobinamide kinase/adenosylcobinamide phosphate guanyltransferase [Carboxydothermus pertinax]